MIMAVVTIKYLMIFFSINSNSNNNDVENVIKNVIINIKMAVVVLFIYRVLNCRELKIFLVDAGMNCMMNTDIRQRMNKTDHSIY